MKRGERVLATAPSNIAVDNIAERLAVYAKQAGAKIVRVRFHTTITTTLPPQISHHPRDDGDDRLAIQHAFSPLS